MKYPEVPLQSSSLVLVPHEFVLSTIEPCAQDRLASIVYSRKGLSVEDFQLPLLYHEVARPHRFPLVYILWQFEWHFLCY